MASTDYGYTPASTSMPYYLQYIEDMKKKAAAQLAAQQAAQQAQAQAAAQAQAQAEQSRQMQNQERHQANSATNQQANDWWYQLTQVPAQYSHVTNLPGSAWAANFLNSFSQYQAQPGVSQAIGNTGYANWTTPTAQQPYQQMQPGYVDPAAIYAANQQARIDKMMGISGAGKTPTGYKYTPGNTPEDWRHFSPANRLIDMFGIQGPGYTQYTGAATNNTPTGGGALPEQPLPTWNFGGGGGRRSSGGYSAGKDVSKWYQAMTQWAINRPQGG